MFAEFYYFVKNEQKFQEILTKHLSLENGFHENGAKECILLISARAFQRIFTCKIWVRYSRSTAAAAENEPFKVR